MAYQHPLPIFTGTIPGKLDPNQTSRVLHHTDNILSFAIYDAHTARNDLDDSQMPDLDNPSVRDELCKGRRIVIETSPSGDSNWRYVPRAHLLHGVQDEGIFPRQVIYCGIRVVFSQDQWDIHKLDTALTCTVHPEPHPPTITVKNSGSIAPHPRSNVYASNTRTSTGLHTPPHNDDSGGSPTPSKRHNDRTGSDSSEEEKSHPKKKQHAATVEDDVSMASAYSAMSIDTVRPHPTVEPSSFNYKDKGVFGNPNVTEDPQTAGTSSNPNKRKLSPNPVPQPKFHARSSEESGTPKRFRPTDEPEPERSPPKPTPNPFGRVFAAKAYDKRKSDRLRQRKDYRNDLFADRYNADMEAMARKHEAEEEFRRQQQEPPRKHTKPLFKGSDYMSWTESPLYTNEELENMRSSDPNQYPHGFQQNFNQSNPPPGSFPRPAFNPYTGFAPGFEPQFQPGFHSFQGFPSGFPPYSQFNNQAGPSQNESGPECADAPQPESSPTPRASPEPEGSHRTRWQSEPVFSDPEERRRAELLASVQKMQELEQDRPLWEAAARERSAREESEAYEREARSQAREQARAEAEYARSQAQAQQRFESEEQERLRKEHAREQFVAQQQHQKENTYSYRRWTAYEAIPRYQELCKVFDASTISGRSLTFDDIPWPVERDPQLLTFQDITWEAVESFFAAAADLMSPANFKGFVSRSNLRFHPDRWRSRGILVAVSNDLERDCLANAANVVSQALTPIWCRLKERTE